MNSALVDVLSSSYSKSPQSTEKQHEVFFGNTNVSNFDPTTTLTTASTTVCTTTTTPPTTVTIAPTSSLLSLKSERRHCLYLSDDPIRFEPVSEVTSVFFDESNQQVGF
ncbi:hypothetical protein HELRODRAFT_165212 [Helobdella robusta]|uniref:Uncharacterized protein n=1 Tax=Helobdella robusta TaxID=6412 RepID=T1EWG1_HELRO|nr:hypothetical protein HELRODRAFT_165212 [Helobdella robusta]ESN93054.1 hypothetical protein HELRODRAFT_165212 [Helobdella robusta]